MSMSDEHDSLHDYIPSAEIRIPSNNDLISTTTDMFEECVEQDSSCTSTSRISEPVAYQSYINDMTSVPANERTKMILATCYGSIVGFSLDIEPYSSLSRNSRPSCNMLKRR